MLSDVNRHTFKAIKRLDTQARKPSTDFMNAYNNSPAIYVCVLFSECLGRGVRADADVHLDRQMVRDLLSPQIQVDNRKGENRHRDYLAVGTRIW